jgi:hypothetical protein
MAIFSQRSPVATADALSIRRRVRKFKATLRWAAVGVRRVLIRKWIVVLDHAEMRGWFPMTADCIRPPR